MLICFHLQTNIEVAEEYVSPCLLLDNLKLLKHENDDDLYIYVHCIETKYVGIKYNNSQIHPKLTSLYQTVNTRRLGWDGTLLGSSAR